MGNTRSGKPAVRQSWKRIFFMMLGVLFGLGIFTFYYAKGGSYFFNDPESCMNCHIMREQFDSWNQSSHKKAANCNSCHTLKNVIGKYIIKGLNGWNHSLAFTTGNFPDPIQIRELNEKIVKKNCIRCHDIMTSQMNDAGSSEELDCSVCHGNVGHRNRT
jgi:cytochrome c nitrite reductase small subunit